MNDDLYFIPIIIEAFKQPDESGALKKAFEQIEQLGKLARYSQGWRQFCLFMNETFSSAEDCRPEQLEEKFIDTFKRPDLFNLTIEKDGLAVETLTFRYTGDSRTVTNITPGSYKLTFESGLCLWQGTVSSSDVLIPEAYPEANLPMAADDIGENRKIPLFGQAGEIKFYAGIGSGSMEIVINRIRI